MDEEIEETTEVIEAQHLEMLAADRRQERLVLIVVGAVAVGTILFGIYVIWWAGLR